MAESYNIAGGPFGFGTSNTGGVGRGPSSNTGVPTFGAQRVTAGMAFDTTGVKALTAELGRMHQVVSGLSVAVEALFRRFADGSKVAKAALSDATAGMKGGTPSALDAGSFSTPPLTPNQASAAAAPAGGGGAAAATPGTPAPMGAGVTFQGAPQVVRTQVGTSPYGALGDEGGGETVSQALGGPSVMQRLGRGGRALGIGMLTGNFSRIDRVLRNTPYFGAGMAAFANAQRYSSAYLNEHLADMVDTDVLLTQLTRMQPGQFTPTARQGMRETIFGREGVAGLASNYYSNTDLLSGIRTMMQGRGFAAPGTQQFQNLMGQVSGISGMMPLLGFEGAAGLQSLMYSPQFHNMALGLTGTSPLQRGGGTQDPREWAAGFLRQMFSGQQMQALGGMTEANITEVFQPGTAAYAQAMAMSGNNPEFVNFLRETGIAMAQNGGQAPDWSTLDQQRGQGFGVDLSASVREFTQATNEVHQSFFRTLIPAMQESFALVTKGVGDLNRALAGTEAGKKTADAVASVISAFGTVSTAVAELDLPLPEVMSNVATLLTGLADLASNSREAWQPVPDRSRHDRGRTATGDGMGSLAPSFAGGGLAGGAFTGDSAAGLHNRTPDKPGHRGVPTARALHEIIHSAGLGHTVTSVVRPGARTRHGNYSFHATGHAIDIASPTGGEATPTRDDPTLLAIYRRLKPLKDQGKLVELIYGGPGGGGWSSIGTRDDHLDHVHAAATEFSLNKGGGNVVTQAMTEALAAGTETGTAGAAAPSGGVAYTAAPEATAGFEYSEADAIAALLGPAAPAVSLPGGAAPSTAASATTGAAPTGSNKEIVKAMAAARGWTGAQWSALENLVQKESGFRHTAQNPKSSAYGLFQFLDSTWSSVGAVKTSDPAKQTEAGLKYIAQRYGTPAAAWAFWQRTDPRPHPGHWYDGPGSSMPGGTTSASYAGDGAGGPMPISRPAGAGVRFGGAGGGSAAGGSTIIVQNATFSANFSASREEAERFIQDALAHLRDQATLSRVGGS